MADLNNWDTPQETLADVTPTESYVSFENFGTSNEAVERSQRLAQAKEDKLERMSQVNQRASLDNSYTDLGGGRLESNRNKIWNDLSDQEYQSLLQYGLDNYTLTKDEAGNVVYDTGESYTGPTRRLYMFGTKNRGREVKFGVAKGSIEGSEARYQDTGFPGDYGWAPGEYGVDVEDKRLDVLLPYDVATMLEGLGHGREAALKDRIVQDRYGDPELSDAYGSGASEYYSSREGLLGAPAEIDQTLGQELFTRYLTDVQQLRSSEGTVGKGAALSNIVREMQEREADRGGFLNRVGNTLAGLGSSFVDSLIVSPVDAVGDLTGLYDIGETEDNTRAVQDFFGYNPVQAERAMEEIGKQWEVVADSDATVAERMRAAGNGALEAFITPEMWGTSMGMLASWVTPGAVLKAIGVGSKFAKTAKAIDTAVEAGEITKAAARAQKAAAFLSIDGAKAALTAQSGFMVSAMGQVNSQYNEFVKNNNGVELEGAEKAKWFAGRFAVQMVNQNLDKLVDFSIIKNPGMIASAIPAVKAMTNREFAQVAKAMAAGSAATAINMGKEAAQEYSQTMMELFNSRYGSEKFSDVEEFTAFLQDERNTTEAGIAALAGAGGAPQFEAIGAVLPATAEVVGGISKAGGALGEKIKKSESATAPEPSVYDTQVAEEEPSEEEITARREAADTFADKTVAKYSSMFSDTEAAATMFADADESVVPTPNLVEELKKDSTGYRAAYDEIEKAEAVLESRRGQENAKDTDEEALKLLRKSKREIFRNFLTDEDQPTLGSGFTPEDVVTEFVNTMDVKDGQLDITAEEEKAVKAYMEANEVPALRFETIRKARIKGKDAYTVHEEALGTGERSASSYRNQLRTLVNTPNPSRKAVARLVDKVDRFLVSQETRKEAYDSVLNQVKADVNNYNEQTAAGKTIFVKPKKTYRIPGYKDNFVSVSVNDGVYSVHPSSQALSDTIQDNIDYLTRTKELYGKQVDAILGKDNPSSLAGITVRPNPSKQNSRDADRKFYEKVGVTKAIIGESPSPQWGSKGDYAQDNGSKINTGEYTENDVVVINTNAKSFSKDSKVRKELEKAYKAGATIVVDAGSRKNNYLHRLLSNYHFKKVKEDGVTKYLPKAKAEPIRSKQAKAKKAEIAKVRLRRRVLKAMELEASISSDTIVSALEAGEVTEAQADRYNKTVEEAKALFPKGVSAMRDYYKSQTAKQSNEVYEELLEVALEHGLESLDLSEAMGSVIERAKAGKITMAAAIEGTKQVETKIKELMDGEDFLVDWKSAQEEAKRGELDFNQWLKETAKALGIKPMQIAKDMLYNAIGKDKKKAYTYFNEKTGDFVRPTTNLYNLPKDENGNVKVSYQVLDLDPNNYVTVNKATPFNTLPAKEMRIAGKQGVKFNSMVNQAVKLLEAAIDKPNLDFNGTKNSILSFTNSPASSLIFDQDMKVNENVAIAAQLGLNNFIKNSGYLLKKGKKTKADLAEILGIDETQISREAVEMLSDKGLLYKTIANSIGKDVASMLGLARKSDSESDAQSYDALVADLGQTALLMGVADGLLELDNSLTAAEFAKTVLKKTGKGLDRGAGAKVIFIQAKEKTEQRLTKIAAAAKEIAEVIPDIDVNRKEPSFHPPKDKVKNKAVAKIRKERLGLNIPGPSQDAIKEAMDTEWTADLDLMREMIDNKELIKIRLGYIEIGSSEYEELSFEEKEVQESINRGIEKSFEEMEWLTKSKGSSISMWFNYFFSKNGRFFVDSNTINPQTDKHLHRFAVQPASHIATYIRKGNKFKVGRKDVTKEVNFALAQAFGFATDKKDTAKINKFAEKILTRLKTPARIKAARRALLKTGKFKPLGIEIEHLGHALQAFKFVEGSLKGKVTSAITAEFDAVTSGFGLKNMQMPIIADREKWLQKVGVVFDIDEVLKAVTDKSMNDILDSGNVRDSYQTLAKDVKFSDNIDESFADLLAETKEQKGNIINDSPYNKNLWEALLGALPKVDTAGNVDKALRNLFKYPFMTFNYSASIKSIRKNLLTGDMMTGLAKEMAKVDLKSTKEKDQPILNLMKVYANDKMSLEELQDTIRNKPMHQIRVPGAKYSMDRYLSQMIEGSYGAKVEKILMEQFGPFVNAQDKVNSAFRAMFEMFSVSFEEKLKEARKKGPVTIDMENKIYEDLKQQWPMIKGPLSNMEQEFMEGDGIGVYAVQTSSPYGSYGGRKPVRANLSKALQEKLGQKDIRVSHMIKQMTAAVAAGSVVPIHYIDGAIMAQTINGLAQANIRGITLIHDAIMPPLVHMAEAQKEYNKQVLEVNNNYSFIYEIGKSLGRFADMIPTGESKYSKILIDDKNEEGKPIKVSLKNFVIGNYNSFAVLANEVASKREELYGDLNKGAKIMHMAGTAEGVYSVEAGTINHKPVEKLEPKGYNIDKEMEVSGVTYPQLTDLTQNLCKGK
jgi:hypothetical protein